MTRPTLPIDFAAQVAIPALGSINSGLTYCRPETNLAIFGQPAVPLPVNCGTPTSKKLKAALITASVGPFRVTGVRPAVESLQRIFAQVQKENPALYAAVGTAGMLCVRKVSTLNFGARYAPIKPLTGAWSITAVSDGVPVSEHWTLYSWDWQEWTGRAWQFMEVR